MLMYTFALTVCLSLARGRTFGPRLPAVSHSIINLGKMDFNVYLNSNPEDLLRSETEMFQPSKLSRSSRSEGCPCQQGRSNVPSPPDFLSKILMNSDLFKDPLNSLACCSSHEQIQEEIFVEFHPKMLPQTMPQTRQVFPSLPQRYPQISAFKQAPSHTVQALPFPLEKLFPKSMLLEGSGTIFLDERFTNKDKIPQKKIEILLSPTKKFKATRTTTGPTSIITITPAIKIVGDKKTTMLYDAMSTNTSVKKDLTQEGLRYKDVESMLIPKTTNTFNQTNTL